MFFFHVITLSLSMCSWYLSVTIDSSKRRKFKSCITGPEDRASNEIEYEQTKVLRERGEIGFIEAKENEENGVNGVDRETKQRCRKGWKRNQSENWGEGSTSLSLSLSSSENETSMVSRSEGIESMDRGDSKRNSGTFVQGFRQTRFDRNSRGWSLELARE